MTVTTPPAADTIQVSSWQELGRLPADMMLLDEQFREICDHARRWACNKQGFAPSPVCLLQPLAEFLDGLAEAVTVAEQQVHREWDDLTAGVVAATSAMHDLDHRVATALPVVR